MFDQVQTFAGEENSSGKDSHEKTREQKYQEKKKTLLGG